MKIITNPQILSAFWAAWAWLAAVAYWDKTPEQLDPVVRMIPGERIFVTWVMVAVLLTVGALCRHHVIGRWIRVAGLVLTTWLLVAWSAAYIYEALMGQNRMWVSGKNYLFLAIAAMATSPFIGRDPRSRHGREE